MTTSLYRDFQTAEQLDAEYDIEATVPDFGAYAQDFVQRSAAVRESVRCIVDVPFGPTVDETYDVFLPSEEFTGPRPAMFFIHGGYWKATTSKVWSYVAQGLCDMGFVVAIENYSLCPKVTVSEIVRQHRAAFAHFRALAGDFGVDSERIVLAGHSAGGHGVASLLQTPWEAEYGLPAVPYAGALAVSGLHDLRPLPHTFVGPELGLTPAEADKLSPVLAIPAQLPPLVLAHGTAETSEFARQTVDFGAAVVAAGHQVDVHALPANHFDILDGLADSSGLLARIVIELAG
jgi:arylformamidase